MSTAKAPRTLNEVPAFVQARTKLVDVERRRDEAALKLAQLEERWRTEEQTAPLEELAAQVLAGNDAATLPKRGPTPRALTEAREQVAVMKRAAELQKAEVQRVAQTAAAQICGAPAVRAEHGALVRKVAEALTALCKAQAAERAFLDGLGDGLGGLASPTTWLRCMPVLAGGYQVLELSDLNSAAAMFLLECVAHGFLSRSELPRELLRLLTK
jgi:hypothetical protein